jgi:uncharacterized protein YktA (UPF0223 family)
MKKTGRIFLVIASIAIIAALQSCQSTKTVTSAKMLKFNFEKGKGYDYELISNIDQEIKGQTIQMDMSAYYSMDVSEDDGSMKTITSTIDRFKMKMGVGGFNIDVYSDKPFPSLGTTRDGKDPVKMLNSLFGAIKGRKFTMKVDAEGKVQEVKGFENMASQIIDSLGSGDDEKQEMMKKFDSQFNAKNMQGQFDRFLYIFPNKEVKVGDTWQKKSDVSGPMAVKYNSTYKVTDIEGEMVTLDEMTKMQSADAIMKMKGDITGTIVVDSKTGLVVTADQEMKITSETNGNLMEIKGKTRIKGKVRN